jgi:hypothetical protein
MSQVSRRPTDSRINAFSAAGSSRTIWFIDALGHEKRMNRLELKHETTSFGQSLKRRWTSGKGFCNKVAAILPSMFGGSGCSCSKTAAELSPRGMAPVPSALFKHGRGRTRAGFPKTRGVAAFTLVEIMMAAGLMGLFVAASMTAIVADQVCSRKAKEEAIAMDFLTKYVENIKALPFASVAPGLPINSIYNGADGAPLITIPATNSWVSLSSAGFQTFYPDLLWLSNRNPKMRVTLTQNSVAGALHDVEINVKVDWDAPLSAGGRLEVQVDVLRTVDVPTL